jgi:hypothetical protein
MTAAYAVTTDDEQRFVEALDRWSPSVLGLALAFADGPATAHRMTEHAWCAALRRGHLADPAASVRLAVVRQMATDDPDVTVRQDPSLRSGTRALRLAVRASGVLVLPQQRTGGSRPSGTGSALVAAPQLADLRLLDPPLRLVLLLSDVQGWPPEEVQALLEVRPAAHRAILGHARRALVQRLQRTSAPA